MSLARFAFQASAFNHSAISPSVKSTTYGRAQPTIFAIVISPRKVTLLCSL